MHPPRYRPPVTKLYPPSTEALLLDRPELVAALASLEDRKLAVVTAPTGSGKSTLLGQAFRRLAAGGWDTAWLSLDRFDNDARRFVLNLIAALAQSRPGLGDALAGLVGASHEVSLTEAMDGVIAECASRADSVRPLALFLDDCQEIDNPDVLAAVGYLVQYSPADTRFVLASQRRLPLGIARLKSRGAVIEIGFDELRLAADEVRDYLGQVQRIRLSDAHVAALADQTEGWICGLQLASIAIRQQADAGGPTWPGRAAAGPDGDFADALLADILNGQSPQLRSFLLATALLDQFCAPLCDALTGRHDGVDMIEALERANLFIIRLDREQIWFRYHHLFQHFLRKQKDAQGKSAVQALQRRASRWYEQNAMPAEALRFALAGGAVAEAVRLLQHWGRTLLREGSFKELHGWLRAVGRADVRTSAELNLLDAWTQLYLGDAIAAGEALDAAERCLPSPESTRRSLADEVLIVRSMCGVTRYDLVNTEWLRPELAHAFGQEDGLQRAYAQVVLGYGARVDGRQSAARRHYVEAIRIADSNDDTVVSLMARYNRAIVDYLCARPDQAIAGLSQWLDEPGNRRWLRAGSTAFLRSAMGLAHTDRLDLAPAEAALDAAVDLLSVTHTFAYVGIARVLRAQVRALTGRRELARADLDAARELGLSRSMDRVLFRGAIAQARIALLDPVPDETVVTQALADAREVLMASGQWARPRPTENAAQFDAVECHRLALAGQYRLLRERAGRAAALEADAGRVRYQIEFLALGALAAARLGDPAGAGRELTTALRLAGPGGVLLPIVACGRGLLEIPLGEHPDSALLAGVLRSAFERLRGGAEPATRQAPAQALHRRERQILALVAQGLRNRDIGIRLHIGEETVKWYLKRAYEALGVKNRAHALAKARELQLLDPG